MDKRTKDLVKRLRPGDVAIIDHEDIDRVSAESLIRSGVEVVVNAARSVTGRYPNIGPLLLCSAGLHLVDNVGQAVFDRLKDGELVTVDGDKVLSRAGEIVGRGESQTVLSIQSKMDQAKVGLGDELERFAVNTLEYMDKERDLLLEGVSLPDTATDFHGRHALVVVRGYEYQEDLRALKPYIREMKPVLIGVDGGADAMREAGYAPAMIIGDMDSVSDDTLGCGAELIVHAYPDGEAPGLKRLEAAGLASKVFRAPGTSEDLALLLAYEKGAELIVAVGTHANLIEFLDKGRKGMASTFLTRLKVGTRLVDAKGVNKLYRSTVKMSHLVLLALAAMATFTAVIMASARVRALLRLVVLTIRSRVGL